MLAANLREKLRLIYEQQLSRVRRQPRNPGTESFEERCLLSTITVTSLADNTDTDGEVTLREAILAANSDASVDGSAAGSGTDRIEFAAGIPSGKILLTEGPLNITESVVIKAPSKKITIDAGGQSRILNVAREAEEVTLNRLRFRNGIDSAVWSESPLLRLIRTQFIENSGEQGGGIRASGSVIAKGSVFTRNIARHGGGALFTNVRLEDSRFISNRASHEGGGLHIGRGTVSGSTFENNQADLGGGLYALPASGDIELKDSMLTGNVATNGSAIYMEGRAYNDVSVKSSTMTGNVARTGGTVHSYGFYCGYDFIMGRAGMEGSTISGNTGHGLVSEGCYSDFDIHGSVISANTGSGVVAEDEVGIVDSVVTGNTRDGVDGGYQTTIANSEISGNVRRAVGGDNVSVQNSAITNNGTGIYAYAAELGNTTIAGNKGRPLMATDSIDLNHVTIVDNVLDGNRPAIDTPGTADVRNSIVAGNFTTDGRDLSLSEGATVSHSLIGSNEGTDFEEARPGSPDANGNLFGTDANPIDPLLGFVYDNGGDTPTAALSHGSPGIDGAASGSTTDQIGRDRGEAPDMGAFEFDAGLHREPVIVIQGTGADERDESLPFRVRATSLPAPGNDVVVIFDVDGGTARPSVDYPDFSPVAATLTSNSPTSVVVSVPLASDDFFSEPDRTLNLIVSDISGPNGGSESGLGTIVNDDRFEVEVTTSPVVEGDAGTQVVQFELTIVNGNFEPFAVEARTSDRTASSADGDYEAREETVRFEGDVGESQFFEVNVNGDSKTELEERFAVLLSWPFNSEGIGVITNDDAGAILNQGTLRVSGSPESDSVVVVSEDGRVTTTVNGVEQIFAAGDVSSISVETGTGNDDVRLETNTNSEVDAGAGNDLVRIIGLGSDVILGGSGRDTLFGGDGLDKVAGGEGADLVHGDGDRDTVFGGAGNDRVYGDGGNDEVYGNGGEDTLFGSIGDDTLRGGSKRDSLNGGKGEDWIFGDNGSDLIVGGDGSDQLLGGSGADTIEGGGGARDTLRGEGGRDSLIGGRGIDVIYGGDDEDTIFGNEGNDLLYGGASQNQGDAARDRIDGGEGDDRIEYFAHAIGGPGNDQIRYVPSGVDGYASGGEGNDSIIGGTGNDTLDGNGGDDFIQGRGGSDLLRGHSGHDFLAGESHDDTLRGGLGNDVLVGGDGTDLIFGNSGSDLLSGGRDNSYAGAMHQLWVSGKSYDNRVADIVAHLTSGGSGTHKYNDSHADQLVDSPGRNYYHARTGLDVFALDDNEQLFELLDQ